MKLEIKLASRVKFSVNAERGGVNREHRCDRGVIATFFNRLFGRHRAIDKRMVIYYGNDKEGLKG